MTSGISFRRLSLLLFPIVLIAGCSREKGEPVYPVSGTILHKGKAVEGAIVAFTPQAKGNSASGITDASGVYKLTTRSSGDGALIGKYSVTVAKYDQKLDPRKPDESKKTAEGGKLADPLDITNEYPSGYNEMQASEIAASLSKNLLPPKFANPATSKLEAEVKQGKNTFDFKLD